MRIARFWKQPRERLRYTVDLDLWLDGDEEVEGIATSVEMAETDPAPLVVQGAWTTPDKRAVVLLVAGGSDGTEYPLTVTVTTDGLQTKEVEITIKVQES